jgi:hypothetical protein
MLVTGRDKQILVLLLVSEDKLESGKIGGIEKWRKNRMYT